MSYRYKDNTFKSLMLAIFITLGGFYMIVTLGPGDGTNEKGKAWIKGNGSASTGIVESEPKRQSSQVMDYGDQVDGSAETQYDSNEPRLQGFPGNGSVYWTNAADVSSATGKLVIEDNTLNMKLKVFNIYAHSTREKIATAYMSGSRIQVNLPAGAYDISMLQGRDYQSEELVFTRDVSQHRLEMLDIRQNKSVTINLTEDPDYDGLNLQAEMMIDSDV